MAISQSRSKRKVSGTKYIAARKKKQYELGSDPTLTYIGKAKIKTKRILGGNTKSSLLSNDTVLIPIKGKIVKAKIESVINNPANVNYTRRNLITKGALVKTDQGEVKITSRPGQTGILQGILQ